MEALDAAFSGRASFTQALADYEAQRNERGMPLCELAMQTISLQPIAPEQRMLMQALQGNQVDTDRFLGLASGVTSPTEFFAPENLGRIIALAQSRAAAA